MSTKFEQTSISIHVRPFLQNFKVLGGLVSEFTIFDYFWPIFTFNFLICISVIRSSCLEQTYICNQLGLFSQNIKGPGQVVSEFKIFDRFCIFVAHLHIFGAITLISILLYPWPITHLHTKLQAWKCNRFWENCTYGQFWHTYIHTYIHTELHTYIHTYIQTDDGRRTLTTPIAPIAIYTYGMGANNNNKGDL